MRYSVFKSIITKTLYDKKSFMIGWSIGAAFMAALTIAFFPAIKDQIGTLFANIPKALEGLTGTAEDYKTITGYVAAGVLDLRMPMITLVMGVILGIGIGVQEESTERLYQLLVLPLSRTKIVLQKWLAMLVVIAVVHAALFVGSLAVITIIGESISLAALLAGTVMCYLITAAGASMSLGIGLAFGRKGLATALASGYLLGSYVLTSLAAQVDWLKQVDYVSIFHYYKAADAVKTGLNMGHVTFMILFSVAMLAIGVFFFRTRDTGTHNA